MSFLLFYDQDFKLVIVASKKSLNYIQKTRLLTDFCNHAKLAFCPEALLISDLGSQCYTAFHLTQKVKISNGIERNLESCVEMYNCAEMRQ